MAVYVEIGAISVHPLPDQIRHPAERENISRAIECERVLGVQSVPGRDLFVNWPEPRIIGLKRVKLRHSFDNTAGKRKKSQPGCRGSGLA